MTPTADTLENVHSMAGAKARLRIEHQRQGFERFAAAIAKAGFKDSARAFRAEAEKAIARAEEFELERLAFEADQASLAAIRIVLDAAGAPTSLSDTERVDWIIQQWKAVSTALATTERANEAPE